jgi:hypothetical protein
MTHTKGDTMTDYEKRVQEYEKQGCTRSDAQGIVQAEDMKAEMSKETKYKVKYVFEVTVKAENQHEAIEKAMDRLNNTDIMDNMQVSEIKKG